MSEDIVIIIVLNSNNGFFVHQRSSKKKTFPSLYGLGAGGHVEPGETPHDAASRELMEELNLQTPIEPLFNFPFQHPAAKYTVHAFLTHYDGALPSCKEFQWSGWMKLNEVAHLSKQNKLCPDTKILFDWWKNQDPSFK